MKSLDQKFLRHHQINKKGCIYEGGNKTFTFPDGSTGSYLEFSKILNEPSFVQFIHRNLAYIIFVYVLYDRFILNQII